MTYKDRGLLSIFLAVELSTEELRALTTACVGAPRLNRVAEAAERAIQSRDAGGGDIDRMALVNAILDGEVNSDTDEEE